MIYIFQLPGMLVSALCSAVSAICGGACRCSGELCRSFPEAFACLADALRGSCELVCGLVQSFNCFTGTLGCGVLLSCFVNGVVIWNASLSMSSATVKECPEPDTNSIAWLVKADLVLAVCHVVFFLYLKFKVATKQVELLQEDREHGRVERKPNVLLRDSIKNLIQYDIAVCLYFFLWVYSFYLNTNGAGLVAKCANHAKSYEGWPGQMVGWLIAYAPLTVFYGCGLYAQLTVNAATEKVGWGARGRNAQAREGVAPYLPLAAGEPPQGAPAPQV